MDAGSGYDVRTKPRQIRRCDQLGWLLIVTLLAWQLGPSLFTRGMFLDGITYGTISRNMAVGIGDFWHPQFSLGENRTFHEHPPLAFGLQSIGFRVCGDQFWVERLYSAVCAPGLIFVIALLWRAGFRGIHEAPIGGWFPVLLWMTIPTWGWLYRNNVLENTLAPFAALSIYASWRMHQDGFRGFWSALGAAAMLAAVLSKGPVGMFPAITPLVAGISFADRDWRTVVRNQLALLAWFSVLVVGLWGYDPARQLLTSYFHDQVMSSLAGERIPQHGRWYLVYKTLAALALPAVVALIIAAWGRRRTDAQLHENGKMQRNSLFFLLTALSASMPLLLSPRQSGMYAAPSYPFFILALSAWCWPGMMPLQFRLATWATSERNFRLAVGGFAALVIFAGIVSINRYGVIARDKELLSDIARIQTLIPARSTVATSPALRQNYVLAAYLARQHYISLDFEATPQRYYLTSTVDPGIENSIALKAAKVPLQEFRLFVESPVDTLRR